MRTLTVKNVPEELYAALQRRAKQRGTTAAAETIALLRAQLPTKAQIRQRRAVYQELLRLQKLTPPRADAPSISDIVRESREELEGRIL